MKKILFSIASAVLLCGCSNTNSNEIPGRLVGQTDQWKIFQVNDSILVCLPYLNANDKLNPVVINLNKADNE